MRDRVFAFAYFLTVGILLTLSVHVVGAVYGGRSFTLTPSAALLALGPGVMMGLAASAVETWRDRAPRRHVAGEAQA